MSTVAKIQTKASTLDDPFCRSTSEMVLRAQIYHFFELALAHPGEDGFDYFRADDTEAAFVDAFAKLGIYGTSNLDRGFTSAKSFFAKLRDQTYEEVESAHINLFSSNFPHLPCPPYGSLFTAVDSEKRLEEMLTIKKFYQENGVDVSDSYEDLPDHLCVELEFSQLMCFREDEAVSKEDEELLHGIRTVQTQFLDRFLLPLGNNLADIAAATLPENLYSDLLETMRCFLLRHREFLDSQVES